MKRAWINRVLRLVATVYAATVVTLSINAARPSLLLWIITAVLSWKITGIDLAEKIRLPRFCYRKCPSWLVALAVALFYASLVWLCGYGSSSDCIGQWDEVLGRRKFHDWAPIVHTGLIWIGERLVRSYSGVVILQGCVFAFLCGWLYSSLVKAKIDHTIALLLVAALVFAPIQLYMIRILWKDVAFALAVFALSIFMFNIVVFGGGWLWKVSRVVGFLLCVFLASFTRHNGIFYTVPLLLLFVFLFDTRREKIRALGIVFASGFLLAGYVITRGQLISHGVVDDSKDQKFAESIGLPLSMMAESYVSSPEKTPVAVVNFLTNLVPNEAWARYCIGFNDVKFTIADFAPRLSDSVTPGQFSLMVKDLVLSDPNSCIKSFLKLTEPAWSPFSEGVNEWMPFYFWDSPSVCANEIAAYTQILNCLGGRYLFFSPGFLNLMLVLLFPYAFRRLGASSFAAIIPTFCYCYGTALMLFGWDFRYFYFVFLNFPMIIASIFSIIRSD